MIHLKISIILFYFTLMSVYTSPPDYGPFKLRITKLDVCAGPRNRNCTILDPTGIDINGGTLVAKLKVLENFTPSKGKIVASSNGKELFRFQMNKPCEHLFLRDLFESMFMISKNCMILKGEYNLKLNMEQIADAYFGGGFFYGNINFKAVLYGKDCNFSCTTLFLSMTPKIAAKTVE